MDAENDNSKTSAGANDRWKIYSDLRRHNQRRARLAQRTKAKRRARIEQAMSSARERTFRRAG